MMLASYMTNNNKVLNICDHCLNVPLGYPKLSLEVGSSQAPIQLQESLPAHSLNFAFGYAAAFCFAAAAVTHSPL